MTILSYTLAAVVLLLSARPVTGFGPIATSGSRRLATSLRMTALTSDFSQSLDLDYDRARECADSFGECSVEDMERMKNALHAERISNFLTARTDLTWPEAELQDRILEEDLSLQLSMLKEKESAVSFEAAEISGIPKPEKIHSDDEMMDLAISVPTRSDVYSATAEADHTASPWLEQFAENGISTFMMKNGEAIAIMATLMFIMFLPEAVHYGMK